MQHDFAQRMVGLILGIDAIDQASLRPTLQGLAREGWVAINLSQVPPLSLNSYAEARSIVAEMRRELDSSGLPAGRLQYFNDYLHAIDTFCHWQDGHDLSYEELVRDL